jgi:hypothetical protein
LKLPVLAGRSVKKPAPSVKRSAVACWTISNPRMRKLPVDSLISRAVGSPSSGDAPALNTTMRVPGAGFPSVPSTRPRMPESMRGALR